jgi:polyhydroxyalkanoate synthase
LRAAQNTIAANPLLGIRAADLKLAARALLKGAAGQPKLFLSHLVDYSGALVDVGAGKSTIRPIPRTSASPTRVAEQLPLRACCRPTAGRAGLDQVHRRHRSEHLDKERARFLVSLIVDGMAPEQHDPRQPGAP